MLFSSFREDDDERPVEIGLRRREERGGRTPHLLELPHQPSRRPLQAFETMVKWRFDLDRLVGGEDAAADQVERRTRAQSTALVNRWSA